MVERLMQDIILTEEQIQSRVKEIASQITKDYEGKEIFLIGVLKGAVMFLSDLSRYIKLPLSIDFMAISSYGTATKNTGVVKIIKDLDEPIESKYVLIVEDIVDSGLTLHYLVNNLKNRNLASLKICTLLDRPHRREVEVTVDYRGFVIEDEFVVGYGLDYNQKYRNIPFIFSLKSEFI